MIVLTAALPNSLIPTDLFPRLDIRESSAEEVAQILTTRKEDLIINVPRLNSMMSLSEVLEMKIIDDRPGNIQIENTGDMVIWGRYRGPWMAEHADKIPEGGTVEFLIMEVMPKAFHTRPLTALTRAQFAALPNYPVQLGDFILDDKLVKVVMHYRNANAYAVIDDQCFMINHLTKQNILDYLEGKK